MLIEKTLNTKHRQAGLTLIELMISIVLGLLILAAATAMTVKSMVINADTLNSARLNQDLDSATQVMVNDIRRAGFTGNVFDFANNEDLNIVSSSCVLYAYDANEDGDLDTDEKFGFKLVRVSDNPVINEIHMRTSCSDPDPVDCATKCDTANGVWAALTDSNTVNVTSLSFDSVHSKCISITETANMTATNPNNFWVTTAAIPPAANPIEFPCLATAGTNLNTYVLDSDGIYQKDGTFVKADLGDRLIEARQVNVEIQAELTNDPTMSKHQVVAINTRNDHIYVIP